VCVMEEFAENFGLCIWKQLTEPLRPVCVGCLLEINDGWKLSKATSQQATRCQ